MLRERVTTLLDAAGLIAVACGSGVAAAGLIVTVFASSGVTALAIGLGLIVGGGVLLGGSWIAARGGE